MEAALNPIAKPATPLRRIANAFAKFSDSRYSAYYLLIPSLLLICAVVLYPTLSGIGLSFREMRLNRPDLGTGFVGLKHYQAMFDDAVFWLSLRNTVVWTTGAALGELSLGLAAALLLNRDLRGFRIASVLILLPWLL